MVSSILDAYSGAVTDSSSKVGSSSEKKSNWIVSPSSSAKKSNWMAGLSSSVDPPASASVSVLVAVSSELTLPPSVVLTSPSSVVVFVASVVLESLVVPPFSVVSVYESSVYVGVSVDSSVVGVVDGSS